MPDHPPHAVEIAAEALRRTNAWSTLCGIGHHEVQVILDALSAAGYHLLTPEEHRVVTAQQDLVQQILADQDDVFAARLQAAMDSVTAREVTPDA